MPGAYCHLLNLGEQPEGFNFKGASIECVGDSLADGCILLFPEGRLILDRSGVE